MDKELNQSNSETFILFELAGTTYGIPSQVVKQMEMIEQITPVPNSAPFVEGVVFSRGQVIPEIDMRARLQLEKLPYDIRTRLIVVETNNRLVGLIVDTAREFVSVNHQDIQPPPQGISGLSGKYLSGIATLGERVVLMINLEEFLNSSEL
ncbi:MAG: chemotaxis protein CheW [Hormoscilla sp.]